MICEACDKPIMVDPADAVVVRDCNLCLSCYVQACGCAVCAAVLPKIRAAEDRAIEAAVAEYRSSYDDDARDFRAAIKRRLGRDPSPFDRLSRGQIVTAALDEGIMQGIEAAASIVGNWTWVWDSYHGTLKVHVPYTRKEGAKEIRPYRDAEELVVRKALGKLNLPMRDKL